MKGMHTCVVCGRDFPLIYEEHYVVRDAEKKGVIPSLSGQQEADMYDAFDCPHCGCQNVMQGRKQVWVDEAYFTETAPPHDGCEGCKYVTLEEDVFPCIQCKHRYTDKYEEE